MARVRPTWLIDAAAELPSEALQREISRQGMDARIVKHYPLKKEPFDILGAESLHLDARVIFLGGPILMRYIQVARRWRPGGWYSFTNFACETYYAYFGRFLLNDSYTFLPAAEAIRKSKELCELYSKNGQVFIRPAPAKKLFSGTVADEGKVRDLLTARDIDPRTLVLIAEPRQIGREWRLFVANDEIIAASQYADQGRIDISEGCPNEVLAFGRNVLEHVEWRPDPLFTMDVCDFDDAFYVLELNGFSCSHLYDANLESIVSSATAAALCC